MLKHYLKIFGFIGGVTLFIFLLYNIGAKPAAWGRLLEFPWFYFPIALALYGVGIALIATAWIGAIHWKSNAIEWKDGFIIYSLSGVGKYIPGNVAQHMSRIALTKKKGVPIKISTLSIILEFSLAAFAATTLSIPTLLLNKTAHQLLPKNASHVWIIYLLLIISLALLTFFLLKRIQPRINFPKLSYRDFKYGALGIILMLLAFLSLSIMSGWVGYSFFNNNPAAFLSFATAFPLAWLLGYFAPGAPAGLGAREFVFVMLLAPQFGSDNVTMMALILRLVTTLGDGIIFIFGYFAHFKNSFMGYK